MPKPLTVSDLEAQVGLPCGNPDCNADHSGGPGNEVWIHGNCHPEGPLHAQYVGGSRFLALYCAECGQLVVDIAVKDTRGWV